MPRVDKAAVRVAVVVVVVLRQPGLRRFQALLQFLEVLPLLHQQDKAAVVFPEQEAQALRVVPKLPHRWI